MGSLLNISMRKYNTFKDKKAEEQAQLLILDFQSKEILLKWLINKQIDLNNCNLSQEWYLFPLQLMNVKYTNGNNNDHIDKMSNYHMKRQ